MYHFFNAISFFLSPCCHSAAAEWSFFSPPVRFFASCIPVNHFLFRPTTTTKRHWFDWLNYDANRLPLICGFIRTIGSHWRGHGPNQCRHEGGREELDRNGKVLWSVRVAVSKVSLILSRYRKLIGFDRGATAHFVFNTRFFSSFDYFVQRFAVQRRRRYVERQRRRENRQ